MSQSNISLPSLTDLTRECVRLLIAVRRGAGIKSRIAVAEVAGELGMTRDRAWKLYYGYADRYVSGVEQAEWLTVRERAAAILLREAEELRRRAERLEAEAQHQTKLKKGNVGSVEKAQSGAVDDVVEGGVLPMLAKVWEDRADKVTFPVAVQPKLDGHRCVAVVEASGSAGVEVSLWTRTRKRIKSLPHIVAELRQVFLARLASGEVKDGTYYLDGENYNHAYRDNFEALTSLIRPDEPRPGHNVVEYHVYDVVSADTFLDRFRKLEHLLFDGTKSIKLVETHVANDEAALMQHYNYFRTAGYEGAMARTLDTPYEHKRSSSLLKMKDFVDAEFRIVRLEEGRGRLQGHCGAFVCVTADGAEFNAKMCGETSALKTAWENPELLINKMMTIKYQGLTSAGMPRFPVAIRFRDEASS